MQRRTRAPSIPQDHAATVSADRLTAALSRAHFAFQPQQARDWQAALHLVVTDDDDRSLHIADGSVRVEVGVGLRRTARLVADAATWVAICEGALTVDDAFQQGRLQADDLSSLLRFATCFDWAAAQAQAAHATTSTPERVLPLPPPRPAAPGRWPVGRRYDGGHALIRADDVAAFARVLGDDNPQYEGPGALVPPTFHARLVRDLLFATMLDPDLDPDLLRVLHVGHTVRYLRPLVVGQLAHMRGVLEQVVDKPGGLLTTTRLFVLVQGEVAVEAVTRFFVRRSIPTSTPSAPVPPADGAPPAWEQRLQVSATAAADYARVSLDDNPLHLDPAFAARAGLPGNILHGLATLGLCAGPLIAREAGGDPRALRSLDVRWTWPVDLDQDVVLRAWHHDSGIRFRLTDDAGAVLLLTGRAAVA